MTNRLYVQQTSTGDPIEVNNLTVYPVARSYQLRIPGMHGGIMWNRPLAVIVEEAGGKREVLPVHDCTRQLQIAILGAGIITSLLTWLVFRRFQR